MNPILSEAQRRVTASHGERPAIVKPDSTPILGFENVGWAVGNREIERFHRALDSFSAAREWDRKVVAECRKIEAERN